MTSLIIALIASCVMSWLFKIAGLMELSVKKIAFFNYLTAFIGLWIFYKAQNAPASSGNLTAGLTFLSAALAASMVLNLIALTLGTAVCGINGATFFNRIGFLVSMILAVIFWRELPSFVQIAGIASLLAGLFVMVRGTSIAGRGPGLPAGLCISSGMVIFFNAVYGRYFPEEKQILFIALVFTTAFLLSTLLLLTGKSAGNNADRGLLKMEALVGILIGLSNIVTTLFTLRSYSALPISIVAPVMSGGNMIFSAILGKAVYHEEFNRNTALAIVLAGISLLLVNL